MSENSPIEHLEHAEHAAHSGDTFLVRVSGSVAIMAVVAATLGSFETVESGRAIADKNESVLLQNQATDVWSFFQAQNIKKNMYDIAAATSVDDARTAAFGKKARDYEAEAAGARHKAEDFEHERDARLADSETHERRHHWLTAGLTLLHVAIAITTLAIILRGRRWPWYTGLALAVAGSVVALLAFL